MKSCSLVSPTQRTQRILISWTWSSFPSVRINFSTKRIDFPTVAGQIITLTCKYFPTNLPNSPLEKKSLFVLSVKHAQFHYAKTLSLKALPFRFSSKKTNHIVHSALTCIQHKIQWFCNQQGWQRGCCSGDWCGKWSWTTLCWSQLLPAISAMGKMDSLHIKTEPEEHIAPLQKHVH